MFRSSVGLMTCTKHDSMANTTDDRATSGRCQFLNIYVQLFFLLCSQIITNFYAKSTIMHKLTNFYAYVDMLNTPMLTANNFPFKVNHMLHTYLVCFQTYVLQHTRYSLFFCPPSKLTAFLLKMGCNIMDLHALVKKKSYEWRGKT